MIRPGTWCDVYRLPDGRVGWARAHELRVIFGDPDRAGDVGIAAGVDMWYLRADCDRGGHLCAIGVHRSDDQAYVVTSEGAVVRVGPCATPFGVEIEPVIGGDGWWTYVQDSPTSYVVTRVMPTGTLGQPVKVSMPATSQGFLEVIRGRLITSDDGRFGPADLILPNRVDDLYVGQLRANGIAVYDDRDGVHQTLFRDLAPTPPHIAQASDGAFYVCCWRADGSWVERVARPLVPDVVTPPPPPPPPPPEENPVEFEKKHSDLMNTFNGRFPAPVTQEGPMRDWTQLLAEQFAYSFPNEEWGCKSTRQGSAQSFDVIARRVGAKLWGYDLAISGGTPNAREDAREQDRALIDPDPTARLDARPAPLDLTGQFFIEVDAQNHLGAPGHEEPPDPEPGPTPKPADLTPIVRRLDTLLTLVNELRARPALDVEAIERELGALRTFVEHQQQGKLLVLDNKLDQLLARPSPERCRFRFSFAGDTAARTDEERISLAQIIELLEAILPALRAITAR